MTDSIISVRIDKKMHEHMRKIEHINWSAIIRKNVQQYLEQLQDEEKFDKVRAERASQDMDRIRNSKVFDGGKTGVEIIREWRDKRKF
ncbi:hypothetical protein HYW75_01795 [Candidatus Pacearchaeota archaeon]|nr:hypothetical protein [Candidatus Pacearchaeota archaeon]